MRIVLDTNILIAAFIARGSCNELVEHCVVHHDLVLSKPILGEFRNVLARKFGFTQSEAGAAARLLQSRAQIVKPSSLPDAVCRDPDDDAVLATALSGNAEAIVSGDKDLTCLKSYRGIKILSPADFWQFEQGLADRDRDAPCGAPLPDH